MTIKAPLSESAPLPDEATLEPKMRNLLKSLPPLNKFRMLANVPQSFSPFIELAHSIYHAGTFDPKLREIAILRVACMTNSIYEWHQHTFIAKFHDVSDTVIDILQTENPVTGLSAEENFICQVADELTTNAALSDGAFKKLFSDYGANQACEIILVISYFNMLVRYLNGTRTQIEADNTLEGHQSPLQK